MGSVSLSWSCPARPLWEGTLCPCPAGVVLDFSRVSGAAPGPRDPLAQQTCGSCLLTHRPSEKSPEWVPVAGAQTPLGHGPQPHWFCRVPSRTQHPYGPGLWPEQLQGSGSALPLRVRAQRSGPAPGHWAGPERQASHTCQSAWVHPRGSRPACWSRQHPRGLGKPNSSLICDALGGLVPSLLIPWHAQPRLPTSTLAQPLSTHDLLPVYLSLCCPWDPAL